MREKVVEYYKHEAETYEMKRFRRGGRLQHEVEMRNVITLLKPSKEDLILDLGAGTGRLETVLQKLNCSVISCDISTEMLAKIRKNSFRIRSDAFRLPFKNEIFDKTIALRLLFHFNEADKMEILREMLRVTKAGGLIVFDVESSHGLLSFILNIRKDHLNYLVSPARLEEMFTQIPRIEYKLYFSFFIPRGIYRHIPKDIARVFLSIDRFLPDAMKRFKCSTIFCSILKF
nr:class I SAM-dependent methyltransferase [Candidatus Freyarchaeota archaeon]